MNGSTNRDVVVFTEALQLPAGQRTAFLDRACGGDTEFLWPTDKPRRQICRPLPKFHSDEIPCRRSLNR